MKMREGKLNVPPVVGRAFPPCEEGGENTPLLLFRFPYISHFPISLTAMDAFSRLSLIFCGIATAVGVSLISTSSAGRTGLTSCGEMSWRSGDKPSPPSQRPLYCSLSVFECPPAVQAPLRPPPYAKMHESALIFIRLPRYGVTGDALREPPGIAGITPAVPRLLPKPLGGRVCPYSLEERNSRRCTSPGSWARV
jgi:hypothetical protein